MLVTFTSSSSGEITTFAETARRLFEIIGKDCTARGVFTTEQLPDAIAKLRRAVAADKSDVRPGQPQAEEIGGENNQDASSVELAQHAYPFIELMELTRKEDGFVMWQAATNF